MRLLAALAGLQVVAILFLAGRVMTLDRDMDAIAAVLESQPVNPSVDASRAPAEPTAIQNPPDEKLLRKVVREELSAQLERYATQQGAASETDAPDPATEAERRYQRELVEQELEHYISQGTISELEIQHLEAEIAKLDKDGQREMLSRLSRAMNSGELEGRL